MESPALWLRERFGIEYRVFDSLAGLKDSDLFLELLSYAERTEPIPLKYMRVRDGY